MALKLIHTADWHLGQSFFGYDREKEHSSFLNWLLKILKEKDVDVLLISGDIFDVANPSAASQRLFYHFLKEANRQNPDLQIIVIAGNHDSAVRLEAPNPLLEELHTIIVGVVRKKQTGEIDFDSLLIPLKNKQGEQEAVCLAVPYLRQGDYPATDEDHDSYVAGVRRMYKSLFGYANEHRLKGQAIIAMGHLHATGAELSEDDRSERAIMGGLDAVPADAFDEGIAYTALGHIHKAQRIGGKENVRYSGSPLPMSFSEKNYRHQVVEIHIEQEKALSIAPIDVPLSVPLLRIPDRPQPPASVLEQLKTLPDIGNSSLDERPYLEVRVLLTEPDPGFRHRVEEVLKDKAVRLTSIVPSYPVREEVKEYVPQSYEDLQKIDPIDMLRHVYAVRYANALPKEMEDLFNEVMREVSL